MSLRSKKFVQKIKVIKYKEERKEIEIVKLEPKCSVPKKPKKVVTDELWNQPTTSVVQEGNCHTCLSNKVSVISMMKSKLLVPVLQICLYFDNLIHFEK